MPWFSEELQKIGISALSQVVKKNGGWPMTMSAREWKRKGYKTWQQVSDILQDNMFNNGLYGILVGVDEKQSDTNVINVRILLVYNKYLYTRNVSLLCYKIPYE